jgi:hypothetical protein
MPRRTGLRKATEWRVRRILAAVTLFEAEYITLRMNFKRYAEAAGAMAVLRAGVFAIVE